MVVHDIGDVGQAAQHRLYLWFGRAIADETGDAITQLRRSADLGLDQLRIFAIADDQHTLEVMATTMRLARQRVQNDAHQPDQRDRQQRPVHQHEPRRLERAVGKKCHTQGGQPAQSNRCANLIEQIYAAEPAPRDVQPPHGEDDHDDQHA